MAITDSFRNAVSSSDVRGIRIMMKDSLLVDPTFTEFNEMEKLTHNVNGLYDSHDGRELKSDKSAWNDDYMNNQMVQIVGNFSHNRVEHLKEVVRYLRPVAARPQSSFASDKDYVKRSTQSSQSNTSQRDYPKSNYQEQKRQDERNNRIVSRGSKITVGAVAGGVVGGAIAGFAGGAVAVGAVAGAVVVGAVVAIATNGE
jgi:hypothetical protein